MAIHHAMTVAVSNRLCSIESVAIESANLPADATLDGPSHRRRVGSAGICGPDLPVGLGEAGWPH